MDALKNDLDPAYFVLNVQTGQRGSAFTPSRWPHTYAYDFVRSHQEFIPTEVKEAYYDKYEESTAYMSRAMASGLCKIWAELAGINRDFMLTQFASAYCKEWNISPYWEDKNEGPDA